MINFIVCDDNKEINKKINNIIKKIMLPKDLKYKILEFNRYDNEFKRIMNSKIGYKVYILDIEVDNVSGLDIIRKIRTKDWNSVIIIISAYYELSYQAFRNRLLILDFISKFDNFENKVKECILLSLNILNSKTCLDFISENIMHKIDYDDILYITRDDKKRKVLIYTYYKTYEINISLFDIEKKLNLNFIKTHRACIVNKNNVKEIDYNENKITFKNGSFCYLLSRTRKKEVKILCGL